jgi:hypothetical protein
MTRHLLLFAMLLTGSQAFAQFNDTINYYANYASTGVINKTNDGSSYVLNNNAKFSMVKKSTSLNMSTGWIYGKQLGVKTNNDVLTTLDANLYKTFKHFYYWGLGTFEKSYSLKINHRLQTGLGVGYNLIDRKKAVLIISDGVLYEKSSLIENDELGRDHYETLRNSFRIKFRFIFKERVTLDGTDFLQHSLSEKKDYIIKSGTNLSIKIQKWLSFTASLTYNKLNLSRTENLLFTYGLTFEKYF